MRTLQLITLLFCGLSCLPRNVLAQDGCETSKLSACDADNDTMKVKRIKAAIFDTTGIYFHGYVRDRKSNAAITGASIIIEHKNGKDSLMTDTNGEFDYWTTPYEKPWSLRISHYHYDCLIVNDMALFGGQWIKFKLKRNLK
jgi:hypothetical protein